MKLNDTPWLEWYYRALCLLFPRSFRLEALQELKQVFRDQVAETPRRPLAILSLLIRTLLDTLQTAWSVRTVARRAPSGTSSAHSPRARRGTSPRPFRWLEDFAHDARHGLRTLRHSPGFTAVAVLVLALGIGANATIFTLIDSLFFAQPPHVIEPERLVRLHRTTDSSDFGAVAYPDFLHFREHNTVFEGMTAFDSDGLVLTLGHGTERFATRGWFVSDNYFEVLGARPALGRFFLPEENLTASTHAVAVVSHGLWQGALGGRSDVIGRESTLNGKPFTIVGVAPEGFRGASPIEAPPDLWVPIMTQPLLAPLPGNYAIERVPGSTWVWLRVIGRLKPEVTLEAAQANVTAMASYLEENYNRWNDGWRATLTPHFDFHPTDRQGLVSVARLLLVVVGVLLLIACGNIAILLLARGSARARETSVRVALGAGVSRVIRQQLTENLLLAFAGGLSGFFVAHWSAALAASWMPMSFSVDFTPRPVIFALALLLAVSVAVLSGLVPALQGSRLDVATFLHRSASAGSQSLLRSALVVGQVALSLVLVVGATLFARSVQTAQAVDLGFQIENRLLVAVNLRNHDYTEEQGGQLIDRALERFDALPDVERASATMMVPFRGMAMTNFQALGVELGDGEGPFSGFNQVGPGYFETMGMPIVRGRGFDQRDGPGAPGAVVVNQHLAELVWPGEDPIGRTVLWDEDRAPVTVVGVVADATYYHLGEEQQSQFYVPVRQAYSPGITFLLETRGPAERLARVARESLLQLDPNLAIPPPRTLEQAFRGEIARFRTAASLVSLFGLLALVLAAVGLYGVLSYLVVRRTREIGIRMALGATRSSVAAMVVGRGLRLTLIGVVLGTTAALIASRFVVSFLYGIEPNDAVTFVTVPLALLAVAYLSSLLPARRAAQVDPVEAIRSE